MMIYGIPSFIGAMFFNKYQRFNPGKTCQVFVTVRKCVLSLLDNLW